jgi:hypothetical protein
MAKDTAGDIGGYAQLLAELGRVTVAVKVARIKQVWEPRRFERPGKADLVTQGFRIEGAGDATSGSFLLDCEIRGEDLVRAASDALVEGQGVALRGQLVIRPRRGRDERLVPTAKVIVSELHREW